MKAPRPPPIIMGLYQGLNLLPDVGDIRLVLSPAHLCPVRAPAAAPAAAAAAVLPSLPLLTLAFIVGLIEMLEREFLTWSLILSKLCWDILAFSWRACCWPPNICCKLLFKDSLERLIFLISTLKFLPRLLISLCNLAIVRALSNLAVNLIVLILPTRLWKFRIRLWILFKYRSTF